MTKNKPQICQAISGRYIIISLLSQAVNGLEKGFVIFRRYFNQLEVRV